MVTFGFMTNVNLNRLKGAQGPIAAAAVSFRSAAPRRRTGREPPAATVIEGNRRLLEVLCGEDPRFDRVSFLRRRPLAHGEIGIAQPGLSRDEFVRSLDAQPSIAVVQTRDLLAVFHDSVSQVAQSVLVLCSL